MICNFDFHINEQVWMKKVIDNVANNFYRQVWVTIPVAVSEGLGSVKYIIIDWSKELLVKVNYSS